MHIVVEPEQLAAAGHRLAGDGALLRGLALLVDGCTEAAVDGPPELAAALSALAERVPATLGPLADCADLLARGLAGAGRAYADAEDRAAVMARRVVL